MHLIVSRGNMSDDKELRAEAKAIMAKSKALRPWYKKKRYWLLALVAFLMVLPLFNKSDSNTSATPETTTTASSELDETTTTTNVATSSTTAGPTETQAQSNARRSGESYLTSSAFSRQGLIDQLIYEGYTQSQSEYGVSTTGL